MAQIKSDWGRLAVLGPLHASCTNLTGTLHATGSSMSGGRGGAEVQIWVPDVTQPDVDSADWAVRSVQQVAEDSVTHLAWAHPESGPLLAGATGRGRVYVWEAPRPLQQGPGGPAAVGEGQGEGSSAMGEGGEGVEDEEGERDWRQNGVLNCGSSAIRHLSFAPRQYGLLVSAASEDGCVHLWEADRPLAPNSWTLQSRVQVATPAAKGGSGCACMSWRSFSPGVPPLFAVGVAGRVRVMQYVAAHMCWQQVATLPLSSPSAVPASLHWAPSLGRPQDLLAAGHGCKADVFRLTGGGSSMQGELHESLEHEADVWKVEWNMLGTCLGVATCENKVHVWRPDFVGQFAEVSVIEGCPELAQEVEREEQMGVIDDVTVD